MAFQNVPFSPPGAVLARLLRDDQSAYGVIEHVATDAPIEADALGSTRLGAASPNGNRRRSQRLLALTGLRRA